MTRKKSKNGKDMGRKPLAKGDKKHLIQVFVKAKHYAIAKRKIQQIAGEYNTKEGKIAV